MFSEKPYLRVSVPLRASVVTGSHSFNNRRNALAAADAGCGEPVLAAALLQLVRQGEQEPRARHPEGMAQCDRAAIDVGLVAIEAELFLPRGTGRRTLHSLR